MGSPPVDHWPVQSERESRIRAWRGGALALIAGAALPLLLASGLVRLGGGELAAGTRAGGGADVVQGRAAAERVGCAELWDAPGKHLARELALRVQFRGWIEEWNPYLTRFGPGQYRAFDAWGETQFPWRPEEHDAPLARLFVRRGSAAEWALETAQRHDGLELQVAVRAAFACQPWVEVLGVRPLESSVPEGSILHASRALQLMERRVWGRAEEELERALAAPLFDEARAELESLRERCRVEALALERRPLLRSGGS